MWKEGEFKEIAVEKESETTSVIKDDVNCDIGEVKEENAQREKVLVETMSLKRWFCGSICR